jgi:hypothetical protein
MFLGKMLYATWKQGKKSFETNDEWGKFFLMLLGSIAAGINLRTNSR